MLRLLILVDCNLDVRVSGIGATRCAGDFAVYNTLINFVKQFTVLSNVDGCGPLVRDSEYEFRKEALVHRVLAVAVVVPLLKDHVFHFTFSVEWCQYAVNPGEKLDVLMACDSVFILGTGLTDECPVLCANRFKFGLG